MIIEGDGWVEPPFIENPEPRFGGVIKKLNELGYAVEQKTYSFNDNIRQKLDTLNSDLTDFVNNILVPTQAHLNARGAVHGENKASIGLSKKDNYRAATIAEQIAFAPVDAFVTPAGAKQSLEANNAQFVLANYQQNDLFQFTSYYFPDEYPTIVPGRVEPTRYFGADPLVGVVMNSDRLVFSPVSDTSVYNDQMAFTSLPVGPIKRSQLTEVPNLNARYTNTGWNTAGAPMSDGSIAFFRPLADKKIYQFQNGLSLPAAGRNFLLFHGFGSAVFKGLAVGYSNTAQTIDITHRFFQVAQFSTNPVLQDVVDGSYQALYDLMSKGTYTGPVNAAHQIDILEYLTLPNGMTAAIGGNNNHGVVISLLWNAVDYEIYMHICVPITLTNAGKTTYISLNIMESIIPGKLSAGGSATIRTVGTRVKDVINADGTLPANPNWTRVNDQFDFNNPLQMPGAVVGKGEVVKSMSNKYGVRVKRYQTQYASFKAWLQDLKRPVVEPKIANTEVFTPARHVTFTPLPERIIPVNHGSGVTQYLVYGLDPSSGKFKWFDMTWEGNAIVSTEAGGRFGVRVPVRTEDNNNVGKMPQGLVISANKAAAGTGLNALVFTTQNGYRGKQSISYVNKVLTLGADVVLSFNSLLPLQAAGAGVLGRAAQANPAINSVSRGTQIQVYALTANKAMIVLSDGVCYAEAGIAGYTITNGQFILDYAATNGLKLTRVTPTGLTATGRYRKSLSGDDVWMPFSDLLVANLGSQAYQFAVVRPFGELYGDISFSVANLLSAAPTFTVGKTNPARLYSRTYQFDLVDEVYPPILIPNKGIYQTDPTNTRFSSDMTEVMGTVKVDPYNINEAGWVRMPAGGRAVINGRTYILDEDFAVKVNTAGTTYCYLTTQNNVLVAIGSAVLREPSNGEVLFGIAVNGVLRLNRQYIVMDNRVVNASRQGASIPCFTDDGALGPNKFFTRRDLIS